VLRLEARILEDFVDLLSPRQARADEWAATYARRPVAPTDFEPAADAAAPMDVESAAEPDIEPEPAPEPLSASEPAPEPVSDPEPAPPAVPEPEPEAATAHLEDEPELVAEFADPGAEEGAGAELHVDEPWSGYGQMNAADIRDRVVSADAAELAVVQLYESGHRKRRSVLEAVERRSKELANAPS
jgi:hypothetical protein